MAPEVSLIYSASEMYDLSDLTPASMYDLTVRYHFHFYSIVINLGFGLMVL